MAIAQMAKVMIVTHRTQASDLLEALQSEGICQILNAEEAVVSRDFPELSAAADRPRDIENQLNRLTKTITFLKTYAEPSKGIASILAPRTVIDLKLYKEVIGQSTDLLAIVGQCEQIEAALEKAYTERENLHGILDMLGPWATLETPVEEIGRLQKTTCLAGLLPLQQLEQAEENISEIDRKSTR